MPFTGRCKFLQCMYGLKIFWVLSSEHPLWNIIIWGDSKGKKFRRIWGKILFCSCPVDSETQITTLPQTIFSLCENRNEVKALFHACWRLLTILFTQWFFFFWNDSIPMKPLWSWSREYCFADSFLNRPTHYTAFKQQGKLLEGSLNKERQLTCTNQRSCYWPVVLKI